MSTSREIEMMIPDAMSVEVNDDSLTVELDDGRTLSVPIVWYPRLSRATPAGRANFCIEGGGSVIHWPDLDEDISVEGLLAGRRSMESQRSFARWLGARGS